MTSLFKVCHNAGVVVLPAEADGFENVRVSNLLPVSILWLALPFVPHVKFSTSIPQIQEAPEQFIKCEGSIFLNPGYWCDLGLNAYSKGIQTNPSEVVIQMKSTSAEQLSGAFQKVCFSLWWMKSQRNLQKGKKKTNTLPFSTYAFVVITNLDQMFICHFSVFSLLSFILRSAVT